jgi:hypothetical protein
MQCLWRSGEEISTWENYRMIQSCDLREQQQQLVDVVVSKIREMGQCSASRTLAQAMLGLAGYSDRINFELSRIRNLDSGNRALFLALVDDDGFGKRLLEDLPINLANELQAFADAAGH